MTVYADSTPEVPVKLTQKEVQALLALAQGIDYGDPVVKAAAQKLKAARDAR